MAPKNKGKGKTIAFIWDHIAHQGDDCLWWPFSKDSRGYGSMCFNGVYYRAHRLMCEIAHGTPPTEQHHAAHSCGNGHLGCVNPRHLSWKTASENQLDRARHGTAATGHGSASRRTPEEFEIIRRAIGTDTVTNLAKRFNTSRRTIERIRNGVKPRFLSQDPKNAQRRKSAG